MERRIPLDFYKLSKDIKGLLKNSSFERFFSKWPKTMKNDTLQLQFVHLYLPANFGIHIIFHGPGNHLDSRVLFILSLSFFSLGLRHAKSDT